MLARVSGRDDRNDESRSTAEPSKRATGVEGTWSTLGAGLGSAGAVVTSRTTRSQQSAADAVAWGDAFAAASRPAQQQALDTSPVIRHRSPAPLVAVASAISGSSNIAAKSRARRPCDIAGMSFTMRCLRHPVKEEGQRAA
jgi:hypothetical protein